MIYQRLIYATFAVLWCFPSAGNADLVLTGGNMLTGAAGGLNEFGNLSGDVVTFDSTDINGFPSAGSGVASAVAASASIDFLFTQIGDEATLSQTISLSQEGVPFGLAEHRFTIDFTAVNDLNFTFTSNFNGLGTAGSPIYFVTLSNLTTLGAVFSDNSQDPTDLNPVENHAGTLIAGHSYSLNGISLLRAGDIPSAVPAAASGTYVFRTSAVPEPTSLFMLGLGGLYLTCVRRVRRYATA